MWQMSVYIVFMAVFAIFGSIIGLKMFTKNSWGVQVNTLHVHPACRNHLVSCYPYCMHIGFDISSMLQLPCSCCCKASAQVYVHNSVTCCTPVLCFADCGDMHCIPPPLFVSDVCNSQVIHLFRHHMTLSMKSTCYAAIVCQCCLQLNNTGTQMTLSMSCLTPVFSSQLAPHPRL